MILAKEKRNSNIVEYVLYMWQIESILRSYELNEEKIMEFVSTQYKTEDDQLEEIKDWYQNLLVMMEKEQKQKEGHLQFLSNVVDDLNRFHLALLQQAIDPGYLQLYNELKADIELIKSKSNKASNEIEAMLNAIYLYLLMKMKQKEVSESTRAGVEGFSKLLASLAKLFKSYEKGDLEMNY